MMSNLFGFITGNTPRKQADVAHVNGVSDVRGTKRKASADPYDEIMESDETPQHTPASQRARSTRLSTGAPSSNTKGRTSVGKIKRRGRSSVGTQVDDTLPEPRNDAPSNLVRAKAPGAARLKSSPIRKIQEKNSEPLVPVADMGDSDLLGGGLADEIPSSSVDTDPPYRTPTQSEEKASKVVPQPEQDVDGQDEENEENEEHEIAQLIKHRMANDGTGAVELLVWWAGEKEEDATWEPEYEIQRGAEQCLYDYWKSQGGRMNALFIKPKNPPAETYIVYQVLGHEKKPRGGFQLEVQWVGHPAMRGETSMEAEVKLKRIAPELLQEYWESIGGREQYVAKRGRTKKPRAD
ncbi:hypothetical protein F5Y15DRAFT_30902 [Xylariaceae sp. FL0016]|nr:hypothetical protein F5Y15DRAFT_30902 [Xylariaceae sp. FL0016]